MTTKIYRDAQQVKTSLTKYEMHTDRGTEIKVFDGFLDAMQPFYSLACDAGILLENSEAAFYSAVQNSTVSGVLRIEPFDRAVKAFNCLSINLDVDFPDNFQIFLIEGIAGDEDDLKKPPAIILYDELEQSVSIYQEGCGVFVFACDKSFSLPDFVSRAYEAHSAYVFALGYVHEETSSDTWKYSVNFPSRSANGYVAVNASESFGKTLA